MKLSEIIDWKTESIYTFDSWKDWNITTVMVWVHGNELAWPQILVKLIKKIDIKFWKVFFIFANLKALEQWVRQVEKNMNRCFVKWNKSGTYEELRAREIMKFLDQSDYLLDVHNTINEQNSIPFLISEHDEIWKFFNVRKIVSWFDELHPWWSDSYMNSIWKVWLCLESWSIYDKNSEIIAENWILNFLKYTWNVDWEAERYSSQEFIKFDYLYKNKTLNFKFTKEFKDFEKIKKWQIIWYDWDLIIKSDRDWFIIFPYIPRNIWDEVFCLWRKY